MANNNLQSAFTLSEAKDTFANLDLYGFRYSSLINYPLNNGTWNIIYTTIEEYGNNLFSYDAPQITETGFYNIGFNASIIADIINDFQLSIGIFIIRDNVEELLLKKDVRILYENKIQNIDLIESINLNKNDRLVLKIKYSKGTVIVKYGAIFAFKVNYEDNSSKVHNLKHYYPLNEISGDAIDTVSNINLLSNSLAVDNGVSRLFTASTNTSFSSNNINLLNDIDYAKGFSIGLWLKINHIVNVNNSSRSYVRIFSCIINTGNIETLLSLYLDTLSFTFVIEYVDANDRKSYLSSRSYANDYYVNNNIEQFKFIVLTYNKNSNNLRLYINGYLDAYLKINLKSLNSSTSFILGSSETSLANIYNDAYYISDLSIFNKEVTVSEIDYIYNGTNISVKNNPEYIQNIYHTDSSGGPLLILPISATDVEFTNNNNTITTVQSKLNSLTAQINNILSSNVTTYNGSITHNNWILDLNKSVYKIVILQSTHGISNPWDVSIQASYNNTYVVGENLCDIEIDSVTNDVWFYVNDVPDGRFSGRFIIIGY